MAIHERDLLDHLEPTIVQELATLIGKDQHKLTEAELSVLDHEKNRSSASSTPNASSLCGSETGVSRCARTGSFWPYLMAINSLAVLWRRREREVEGAAFVRKRGSQ